MPTVLWWNGFRFYFFSNEGAEPPHIHVDKGGATTKIWLADLAVARNVGFGPRELAEIRAKVEQERDVFLEAWRGYFGS